MLNVSDFLYYPRRWNEIKRLDNRKRVYHKQKSMLFIGFPQFLDWVESVLTFHLHKTPTISFCKPENYVDVNVNYLTDRPILKLEQSFSLFTAYSICHLHSILSTIKKSSFLQCNETSIYELFALSFSFNSLTSSHSSFSSIAANI